MRQEAFVRDGFKPYLIQRCKNFFERRAGWERQQLCWEVAVPSFYKPLK